MNKKNLTKWELRLGVWQVVAMIGVVTGCMTFAFCLGFFSGQSVGFETARASSAASSAKLPIVADNGDAKDAVAVAEEAVSEVYAKLNDKGAAKDGGADAEVPVIGTIKEAELPQAVEEEAPAIEPEAVKPPPAAADSAKDIGEIWDKKIEVAPVAPVEADKNSQAAVPVVDAAPKDAVPGEGDAKHAAVSSTLTDAQKKAIDAEAPVHEAIKTKAIDQAPIKDAAVVKKEEVKAPPVKEEKKEVKKVEVPAKVEAAKLDSKVEKNPPAEVKKGDGARIVRGAIPKGWFAQVAAPKKGQDAEKIASQLKQSGFTVVIEDAQVRGEQYYRILVGPENNRKEAEVLLGQLKRESYLQGEPFIRMVK